MASDTRPDSDAADSSQLRAVARRLGIEHRHSIGTTGLVVVLALICGLYAAWLLADFGLRWPALVVVFLLGGVRFYGRPTRVGVLAAGLYTLAVFIAVTPVILDLAFVLAADSYGVANPWSFVLTMADLLFLVVFVLLALIPAGIAYITKRRAS